MPSSVCLEALLLMLSVLLGLPQWMLLLLVPWQSERSLLWGLQVQVCSLPGTCAGSGGGCPAQGSNTSDTEEGAQPCFIRNLIIPG